MKTKPKAARWRPISETPNDGDECIVKTRAGTTYDAVWIEMGGVTGWMINIRLTTRRGIGRFTHWRLKP